MEAQTRGWSKADLFSATLVTGMLGDLPPKAMTANGCTAYVQTMHCSLHDSAPRAQVARPCIPQDGTWCFNTLQAADPNPRATRTKLAHVPMSQMKTALNHSMPPHLGKTDPYKPSIPGFHFLRDSLSSACPTPSLCHSLYQPDQRSRDGRTFPRSDGSSSTQRRPLGLGRRLRRRPESAEARPCAVGRGGGGGHAAPWQCREKSTA